LDITNILSRGEQNTLVGDCLDLIDMRKASLAFNNNGVYGIRLFELIDCIVRTFFAINGVGLILTLLPKKHNKIIRT
jgi:hypothetical protein